MRSVFKLGLAVFFLLIPILGPAAKAAAADDYADTVLLSPEQGEALAAFALQSERRIRHPKPDCSHLVHLLYARAGLTYPYEDSRVLYRGVSDFQRVKTPQPGDLAVWLGHVGIVLSPQEKTFLSSVRSGIITESWTAPHWVRRGHPRFYRYRIGPDTDMDLLARIMNDDNLSQLATRRNAHSESDSELPSSAIADSDTASSQQVRTDSSVQDAKDTDESDTRLRSIVAVIAQRPMPSRRQIEVAILENSKARANQLIAGETLDVAHPFSVFSRLEVGKIKVKHERGSVILEINETMCQEDGRILPQRIMKRELSIVRKNDGVWVISDPGERTYLAEVQASEILERQVELSLRRTPNSNNTRVMVKALDHLYDQQTGAPQRAAIR